MCKQWKKAMLMVATMIIIKNLVINNVIIWELEYGFWLAWGLAGACQSLSAQTSLGQALCVFWVKAPHPTHPKQTESLTQVISFWWRIWRNPGPQHCLMLGERSLDYLVPKLVIKNLKLSFDSLRPSLSPSLVSLFIFSGMRLWSMIGTSLFVSLKKFD